MASRRIRDNRRALYDQGMNDAQIARALALSRGSISGWRRRLNLPSNLCARVERVNSTLSAQREQYRALYDLGMTDAAIGRAAGGGRARVRQWRNRYGLPPMRRGYARLTKKENQHRIALHALGLTDIALGIVSGVGRSAVHQWRTRQGLPRNRESANLIPLPGVRLLSMDADLGSGTMHRWLRDDSWSNWLEEMGATVW